MRSANGCRLFPRDGKARLLSTLQAALCATATFSVATSAHNDARRISRDNRKTWAVADRGSPPTWRRRAHISTMGFWRAGHPASRSAFLAVPDRYKENRRTGHASIGRLIFMFTAIAGLLARKNSSVTNLFRNGHLDEFKHNVDRLTSSRRSPD